MNILLYILFSIGVIFLIVYIWYTEKKNAYVNNIMQKYPLQVKALCKLDSDFILLTSAAKKEILSFDKAYWEDWKNKIIRLESLSLKFPDVISEYILNYFPYVKDNPQYRHQEIFDRKDKLCRTLITLLLYDDVLKLDLISSDDWMKLDNSLKEAESIALSNPDAISELRKKNAGLTNSDIIKLKNYIEQLQLRYTVAAAFDAWLPTQKKFNSLVRDLRDEHAKNCGCYTYDIEFHKPLSSGKYTSEKFSVWQIFPESISPYLKEFHSSLSFSMTQNIPEFKTRQRYFNNCVYDRIIPYLNAISTDKKVLVVFNNRSSYKWEPQTYTYHYKYLKSILISNNIAFIDFDDITTIIDSFKFDIIFVFDFITVNSDLIYTTKLIIESFSTKIPNIVWYSMIKEYDESEMKKLCADAIKAQELKNKEAEQKAKEEQARRDIVQSKPKSILFIKSQLQRMNKSSRFSIFAITNTLIGSAANSSDVKEIWLPDPFEIQVTSSSQEIVKKEGYITVKYSNDWGHTWHIFEKSGEYNNIDDVSNFTYELFVKLDVLADFIEHGASAIDYMNNHNYLSY